MKLRFAAAAAVLVLAACAAPPTAVEPAAPSFDAGLVDDGGNGIGSGNFYDDSEGFGSEDSTLQSDTAGRDPNMIGSGNSVSSDGGGMIGSGNFYDDGGWSGTGGESTQSVQSDTIGRGGSSLGSGN